jgi:hypothetical protein
MLHPVYSERDFKYIMGVSPISSNRFYFIFFFYLDLKYSIKEALKHIMDNEFLIRNVFTQFILKFKISDI